MFLDKSKTSLSLSNTFILFAILLAFASVFVTVGVLVGNYLVSFQELPTEPVISAPTRVPTAVPTVDQTANWKTYKSEEYDFEVRYPSTYELELSEDIEKFYDHITTLRLYPYEISIKAIYNIDVYEDASAAIVVNREMNDSGLEYMIEEKNIGSYLFAVATTKLGGGNQIKKTAIVRHPTKNLYLEFTLGTFSIAVSNKEDIPSYQFRSSQEFEQILSTFKFTQ